MDTRIIDKIKKCLALGASANPHEAAAAMAMAQALMAKHGIALTQVEASAPTTLEDIVETRVRSIATAARCKDWELRLFRCVADAFGCDLLFARGVPRAEIECRMLPTTHQYAHYVIVGVKSEAEIAAYAAATLLRQLGRDRARFTRATRNNFWSRARLSDEVDAYCLGWVEAAAAKLEPLRDARRRAAEAAEADGSARAGTALMVLSAEDQKLARLRDHLAARSTGDKTKMNNSGMGSAQAQWQGRVDGSRATVHRAVGGPEPRSRRGEIE